MQDSLNAYPQRLLRLTGAVYHAILYLPGAKPILFFKSQNDSLSQKVGVRYFFLSLGVKKNSWSQTVSQKGGVRY